MRCARLTLILRLKKGITADGCLPNGAKVWIIDVEVECHLKSTRDVGVPWFLQQYTTF